MRKSQALKALMVAAVTAPLLTLGTAGSASAASPVTWNNGAKARLYFLMAQSGGGPVTVGDPINAGTHWYDVENSDGTWNEIDNWGRCLAAHGSAVVTENCNSAPNGTNSSERWHEHHYQNGSDGWELINASNGYYLDWTAASFNWGTVYAHNGEANNPNERWY
jgi:hypothetical protein